MAVDRVHWQQSHDESNCIVNHWDDGQNIANTIDQQISIPLCVSLSLLQSAGYKQKRDLLNNRTACPRSYKIGINAPNNKDWTYTRSWKRDKTSNTHFLRRAESNSKKAAPQGAAPFRATKYDKPLRGATWRHLLVGTGQPARRSATLRQRDLTAKFSCFSVVINLVSS
uniref:Uncharacterized protein n=1 Tax=Romanomermis culicivorax TaxID=13658 RepID=A0A915IUS7_ROMCU